MANPTVRKLEPFVPLSKDEFRRRFMQRFYDPAFDRVREELDRVCEQAGEGFQDPGYELPLEWLATRQITSHWSYFAAGGTLTLTGLGLATWFVLLMSLQELTTRDARARSDLAR